MRMRVVDVWGVIMFMGVVGGEREPEAGDHEHESYDELPGNIDIP